MPPRPDNNDSYWPRFPVKGSPITHWAIWLLIASVGSVVAAIPVVLCIAFPLSLLAVFDGKADENRSEVVRQLVAVAVSTVVFGIMLFVYMGRPNRKPFTEKAVKRFWLAAKACFAVLSVTFALIIAALIADLFLSDRRGDEFMPSVVAYRYGLIWHWLPYAFSAVLSVASGLMTYATGPRVGLNVFDSERGYWRVIRTKTFWIFVFILSGGVVFGMGKLILKRGEEFQKPPIDQPAIEFSPFDKNW